MTLPAVENVVAFDSKRIIRRKPQTIPYIVYGLRSTVAQRHTTEGRQNQTHV